MLDVDAAGGRGRRGDRGRRRRGVRAACDVTDAAAVRPRPPAIVARAGRVDVLVNSAGTAHRSPAEDFPEDQLDRVLALNLKGTYLACQAFGRHMLAQRRRHIVNIASIGGFVAYPHASAYLASKGGVVQLTRGLALEWIGRVRVNGIAPTLFDTPLTSRGARRTSVTSDFIKARLLREGLAQPHHVVGAAVFLAGDASAARDRPHAAGRRRLPDRLSWLHRHLAARIPRQVARTLMWPYWRRNLSASSSPIELRLGRALDSSSLVNNGGYGLGGSAFASTTITGTAAGDERRVLMAATLGRTMPIRPHAKSITPMSGTPRCSTSERV